MAVKLVIKTATSPTQNGPGTFEKKKNGYLIIYYFYFVIFNLKEIIIKRSLL
jgi:hypothetical protein